MTRRLLGIALYVAAAIAVVFCVVLFLGSNMQIFGSLRSVSMLVVVLLVALRVATLIVNGLGIHACVAPFNVRLSMSEWFGLSVVGTLGNIVTPFSGGTIARIGYLKSYCGISFNAIITLTVAGQLVAYMASGVVGLLLLVLTGTISHPVWPILGFFALVTLLSAIVVILPARSLQSSSAIPARLRTALQGWAAMRSHRNLIVKLVLYSLVNILLTGVSFHLAYNAIGVKIPAVHAQLLGILSAFSGLIAITPGALGIQELVVSMSSGLLGAGVGEGLVATVMVRAATLVPVFVLGPIFSVILARRLARGKAHANQAAHAPMSSDGVV